MGNETLLFHGSNKGLEILGLCLDTGQPLVSEGGIYRKGLGIIGLETSMTTNPIYALHWGYDVLMVTSLEKILNCRTISNVYQSAPTVYKFKGSLPSEEIMAFFLDSLLSSFISQEFLKKTKEHFPHAKVYSYSPDIHEKDGNLPYDLFQNLHY